MTVGGRNRSVTPYCSMASSTAPGFALGSTTTVPPRAVAARLSSPAVCVIGAAARFTIASSEP